MNQVKTRTHSTSTLSAIAAFMLFVSVTNLEASVFYDWTPSTGNSYGFLEFDMNIPDPLNFNPESAISGIFNFNTGTFQDEFNVLEPFTGRLGFRGIEFAAVNGVLQTGGIRFVNFGPLNRMWLEVDSISCIVIDTGCGTTRPGEAVAEQGSWSYRQSTAIPEPSVAMCLAAGLVGMTATIRRQRRKYQTVGGRSAVPSDR